MWKHFEIFGVSWYSHFSQGADVKTAASKEDLVPQGKKKESLFHEAHNYGLRKTDNNPPPTHTHTHFFRFTSV